MYSSYVIGLQRLSEVCNGPKMLKTDCRGTARPALHACIQQVVLVTVMKL